MPFKGVIELREGKAFISGRIPLAPSIFIFIWFLIWTVAGLSIVLFSKENALEGLAFIVGGYFFLGVILGTSFYIEKKRFMTVLAEIKESLGLPAEIESKNDGLFVFELKYFLIFAAVIGVLLILVHQLFPDK